jgi:hypothetical protein
MKKLGSLGFASVLVFLLSAVPAFAGSELPAPGADVRGITVRPAGAAAGSTAFTGAGLNVTLWMVIAVALLVVGGALSVAGRRRRAAGSA